MLGPLLKVQMWICVAGARDCAPCQKGAKREGFVAVSKAWAGVGHLKRRCIFRGRRSTRDMFIRDVRRSGRWFPERGCILEHQISRFAKMILRDRCSTSYDLASLCRGRRITVHRWSGKIAQLGPCVRAFWESGVLFQMLHLKLHFTLHTSHCTLHTPRSTLHTSHSTLHTSHSTLHTSHCALRTPHFTSHCTLKTPHFTLHTSHFTLHTSHFTLHTALRTSHCIFHTPHFALHASSHLSSSHIYPSSSLLISSLLMCHLNFHKSLPSTTCYYKTCTK